MIIKEKYYIFNGDALRSGWAGLKANGMQTGQFNEFLRGMERVMSEGIQKGFVRSTDDVAKSLTLISNIGGGSELWKGELGAQRLSQMNSGLEAAKNVGDVDQVLAFTATRKAMEAANPGKTFDSIDVQIEIEKGMLSKYADNIIKNFLDLVEQSEGVGNRGDQIRRVSKVFTNNNYTLGEQILENRHRIGYSPLSNQPVLPGYQSQDFTYSVESQQVRNETIIAGIGFHAEEMNKSIAEIRDQLRKTTGYSIPNQTVDKPAGRPIGGLDGDYGREIDAFLVDRGESKSGAIAHREFLKLASDGYIDKEDVRILIPYLEAMIKETNKNEDMLRALVTHIKEVEVEVRN